MEKNTIIFVAVAFAIVAVVMLLFLNAQSVPYISESTYFIGS